MVGRIRVLCLILGIAIAVGCGSKKAIEPESGPVAAKPSLPAGTWACEVNGATITVSFSSDGRFQTVFRGGKDRSVVKGKAKLEGQQVVLEATDINGKQASNEKPAFLKFTSDWSTLTSEDGHVMKRKI